MSARTIGIFGGTFAPIHAGHLLAARAFLDGCALDELHLIPTHLPPHKQLQSPFSAEDRLAMTRLAVAECLPDARVVVDDYEIARGGVSYTYQTLEHFAAPDRTLWLLCGTDMFLTLPEWKNPTRIFSLSNVAYVLRGQEDETTLMRLAEAARRYETEYGATVRAISTEPIAISSTQLREALARAQDCAYLPKSVKKYIRDHRFYTKEQA